MASLPIERMISDRAFFAEPRVLPARRATANFPGAGARLFPPCVAPLFPATVGVGLPTVSTLQGLLETGDKILGSGTLSYIFNDFTGPPPFSEVVGEAKERGYTEPDPRDDLSGMDVARKVLGYVGVIDVTNQRGLVELQKYDSGHPFTQLSGSDNSIAFTTIRYSKQPLIVRGPGVGAEVIAGGICRDILRLTSYLGAPS